ncbi:serine hydrolase [Streptosporangium lutulentum]|uniref:CubicO group peptidase (Beta-lactamase class C family) n=1 Tax=Streptosporangium lutulentum TaxID=1461250 RepID=A0ABT9QP33_9ACTN|nr:serine hydrolase [Streptosporangium lutulentum]MDP9847674.1 CubicO group peptidase (beta-lactamase class C family) [Streptosporangium lutulentum]
MTDLDTLRGRLEKLLAVRAPELGVPGATVAVYQAGAEFHLCHGVTSTENPLPVTEDTLFSIGSVTKTYTATAIVRLAGLGKVELDAPVTRYVPELALKETKITVLQLLNHTAGFNGGDGAGGPSRDDGALAAFVDRMARLEQVFSPGRVVSYNNAAFCLAGRVIEKVTGKTYEAAIKELVFDRAGLRNSFFDVADVITRRFAVGHGNKGADDGSTAVIHSWHMERDRAAAGGVFCDIRDLLAYGRHHLDDEDLALMRLPSTDLPYDDTQMGLSWTLRDFEGGRVVQHTGGTVCGAAVLQLVPERDVAVAVTVNTIGTGSVTLLREIEELILEDHLGLVPAVPKPVSLTAEELAEYAGTYDRGDGHLLVVRPDGDRLEVLREYSEAIIARYRALKPDLVIPVQEPLTLIPLAGDAFFQAGRSGRQPDGTFVRLADGKIVGVRWSHRVARRIA